MWQQKTKLRPPKFGAGEDFGVRGGPIIEVFVCEEDYQVVMLCLTEQHETNVPTLSPQCYLSQSNVA